jgi:hypothetical protein
MNVLDFPAESRTRRVRAGQPVLDNFNPADNVVATLVESACELAHLNGARHGYIDGARAGRVAGFTWGLMIGAGLATAIAVWATP